MKARKTIGDGLVDQDAEGEGADHPPPGLGAGGELVIALAGLRQRRTPRSTLASDQHGIDAGRGIDDIGRDAEELAHGALPLASRDDGARAIEHGQRREQQQRREIERAPQPGREPDPEQHREQAEGKGAVALAERPGIAALAPDHRPERAGHLGDDAGDHHQHHERRIDARNQREGQIERRVGDHVGEFVQHRAVARSPGRAPRAIIPSMALSAMRRNSVTGSSSSGQGDPGIKREPRALRDAQQQARRASRHWR